MRTPSISPSAWSSWLRRLTPSSFPPGSSTALPSRYLSASVSAVFTSLPTHRPSPAQQQGKCRRTLLLPLALHDRLVHERPKLILKARTGRREHLRHEHGDHFLHGVHPELRVVRAAPAEFPDRARTPAPPDVLHDLEAETEPEPPFLIEVADVVGG